MFRPLEISRVEFVRFYNFATNVSVVVFRVNICGVTDIRYVKLEPRRLEERSNKWAYGRFRTIVMCLFKL